MASTTRAERHRWPPRCGRAVTAGGRERSPSSKPRDRSRSTAAPRASGDHPGWPSTRRPACPARPRSARSSRPDPGRRRPGGGVGVAPVLAQDVADAPQLAVPVGRAMASPARPANTGARPSAASIPRRRTAVVAVGPRRRATRAGTAAVASSRAATSSDQPARDRASVYTAVRNPGSKTAKAATTAPDAVRRGPTRDPTHSHRGSPARSRRRADGWSGRTRPRASRSARSRRAAGAPDRLPDDPGPPRREVTA